MLRKIILALTESYKDKIENTLIYEDFVRAMKNFHTDVELFVGEEYAELLQVSGGRRTQIGSIEAENTEKETIVMQNKDCLFLSDSEEVLEKLQADGCFTIAVYHEEVTGILPGTQYAIEGLEDIDWEYLNKVHQRFCRIPWDITETKRCTIREMGENDLEDLYELYANPQVTKYTEALFQNKEQEKQYINDYIENVYKYYGFGTWLIHRKEDGKLIGRAGFNYRPGFEEAELGFVIGYPYWRMGYAYEVCNHLLHIGKTIYEFEKVQALVHKENEASVQLLKKLGFYYDNDVIVDGLEYQRYLYD